LLICLRAFTPRSRMRLPIRAVTLLALAAAAITCTDAPTAPVDGAGLRAARLDLAPSFSPEATRAYSALGSMGIVVTQARVRLTKADGTVARDATFVLAATQDSVTIELPLQIQGAEQTFTALIELLDATGMVLFARTQQLTARAVNLPPAPVPAITLEYVGPGYSARAITVMPAVVTIPAGSATTFTASALDAAGRAVPELLLGWRSSDTTVATVTGTKATAVVQGTGRRGTVTISALSPTGVSGSAQLVLTPLAARLVVVSGNAQADTVGRMLPDPFVVRVTDNFDVPVSGTAVSWTRIAGVGALAAASTTSDAAGLARVSYRLGTTVGVDTVRAALGAATTGAATALFSTRSINLAAKIIAIVSGSGQRAAVATALPAPLVARVTDSLGNPVRGLLVQWRAVVPATVTLAPEMSLTGADGMAQTRATLGTTAGVVGVTATAASLTAAFDATALAGPPTNVGFVTAWPDATATGAGLVIARQPVLQLYDAYGNLAPAGGVPVSASIASGPQPTAMLGGASAVTDASGRGAFSQLSVGGTKGTYTLRFAAGSYTPATSGTLSIVAGTPAKLAMVSQPNSATNGLPLAPPPALRLTDAYGNGIVGVPVTAAATGAPAVVLSGTLTVSTNADGTATFSALTLVGVGLNPSLVFTAATTPALSVTSAPISILP
jgi:hypothetical protein